MLKKLSIQHYKGFYRKQSVEFAIPDGVKDGSGLTLIVGPNNTGKSTIIESLLLSGDKKFTDVERHVRQRVKVVIENNAGNKTEFSNDLDSSTIKTSGAHHDINFELVPSRRAWQHEFTGKQTFDVFVPQSIKPNLRRIDPSILGPLLNTIRNNEVLKTKFDDLLKRLLPHFTGWEIDTNSIQQDYIKYKTSITTHQSNLLGEGFISLFRIAAHLVHDETSTFVIDEPELSLHPTAQKRLADVISELSKNKQFVVCTHSPYFVSWYDFINGAKIVRLNKHGDDKCTTSGLNIAQDYGRFINRNVNEYQKPQLLDTTAKEILFSDRILFVEGQEDVGLIRRWARENRKDFNFDIFGYGVGGESNMKLFLKMAHDLKVERVGALYDRNARSYADDKATYPDCLLQKLNTNDIRDKKEDKIVVTTGTFDSQGRLKSPEKVGFETIMNNFINHFEN